MATTHGSLLDSVTSRFPNWVIAARTFRGDDTLLLKSAGVREVCRALRDEPAWAFDFLMDLTGVDYLTFGHSQASEPSMRTPAPLPYFMKPKPVTETWSRGVDEAARFDVVYHLYSFSAHQYLRVLTSVGEEKPELPTVCEIWRGAEWHEREVFDMMGIRFSGHPDLLRILMWEGYPHHPLRKEFPLAGLTVDDVVKPAPMAGGPFATLPGEKTTVEREPRAKG